MTLIMVTFIISLLSFIIIGVLSALKAEKTAEDYLIASRKVNPWLTSLSAVATNNSGYMFIGLLGAIYAWGVSAIWIQIGIVVGDYFSWRWFYKKLRESSDKKDIRTVPSFIGLSENGFSRLLVVLAAIITLIFLGGYAAAQFNAGSKALHVLFNWDYSIGAIIVAAIVLVYCVAGGIRASIWTDVAQSIIMIIGMFIMLGISIYTVGNPFELFAKLRQVDSSLLNPVPSNIGAGPAPLFFVIGWLFAGLGTIGQPHVQIRTMAIQSPKLIKKARRIYFLWLVPFSIAVIFTALYARILIPNTTEFDPELALPTLAMNLLPDLFVGLMLAALFAATISTADSQILVCSAALTQDILPKHRNNRGLTKLATVISTGFILIFALYGPESVFEIVVMTWSVLGASLGPLIILRTFRMPVKTSIATMMMVFSVATVMIWKFILGYSDYVYDILPGFFISFIIYAISRAEAKKD